MNYLQIPRCQRAVLAVGAMAGVLSLCLPFASAMQAKPKKVHAQDPGGETSETNPNFNGREVSGTANRAGDQGSQSAKFEGDQAVLKGRHAGSSVAIARDLPIRPVHPADHRADVDCRSADAQGDAVINMKTGGTDAEASGGHSFAGSASNAGRGAACGVVTRGAGHSGKAHGSPTGASSSTSCKVTGQAKNDPSPIVKIAFCTEPAATAATPVPVLPAGTPKMEFRIYTRALNDAARIVPEAGVPLSMWIMVANTTLQAQDPSSSITLGTMGPEAGKIVVAGPSPLVATFTGWKPPFTSVRTTTVP